MPRTNRRSLLIAAPAALGPAPVAAAPPPLPWSRTVLENRTRRRLRELPARVGFYARHVNTGRELALNPDAVMNTASIIKIAIMVQAFRDAEEGILDLNERYEITADDLRRGSGLIQTFATGLQPTLRDLVRQMMVTSDNVGTDVILRRVQIARVNQLLAELGFRTTRVQHLTADLSRYIFVAADPANASLTDAQIYELGVPDVSPARLRQLIRNLLTDPTLWLGRSTAREMSALLLRLLKGELASPAATEEMLNILLGQFYTSRLPRRIKERVRVGHKTGDSEPYVMSDAGIIYGPSGPIVVTVFVTDNRGRVLDVEEAIGLVAEDLLDAWQSL